MSQVITTILLDGNPKGLRLIKMANWNGQAFVLPRGKLREIRQREDIKQPGIYFLFGEGQEKSKVYIGQSENIFDRLISHDSFREVEEWNDAFVFVGGLDSTFIKYLESATIELVKKAARYEVLNSAMPKENKLSEEQKIITSEYLEKMKIIIGLFGYNIFQEVTKKESADLYFAEDKKNKDAKGMGTLLESGEFVVYKGSLARIEEKPGLPSSSKALRLELQQLGVLKKENGKSFIFTKDYAFRTPSAAGDVIMARSVNGWTQWKDKDGKTLDENKRK